MTETTIVEKQSAAVHDLSEAVVSQVATAVEGKHDAIRLALLTLLSGGHLLIEDVPGVGKTMLAKALGRALGVSTARIQFTPDLLPSDITGVSVFNQQTRAFDFQPGPVFTNVLLADEINRASPKTQSALLEAMEELQVSADGRTHTLTPPFMVIATANPVEMDGTYQLPEAQRDRFMIRLTMGYPAPAAEVAMLAAQTGPHEEHRPRVLERIRTVSSPEQIVTAVRQIRDVHAAEGLLRYVVELAAATRAHALIGLGASPRAAVHLVRAAKAHAAMDGRAWVAPEDVRAIAPSVLTHRLHVSSQGVARGYDAGSLLAEVLDRTPVRGGD
jgi:MoxR-like ATPase